MSKPAEKTITELKAEWHAAWKAYKTAHEACEYARKTEDAARKAYWGEAYWSEK